jgi:hypothetical protein
MIYGLGKKWKLGVTVMAIVVAVVMAGIGICGYLRGRKRRLLNMAEFESKILSLVIYKPKERG